MAAVNTRSMSARACWECPACPGTGIFEGRILVVTDDNVGRLYLDRLRPVLAVSTTSADWILPAGEETRRSQAGAASSMN